MANERLGSRRAAVVQDANFIGTFWLRTSLLPEPARSEAQARLRRYLDLHFEHREAIIDEDRTESIEAEAARLQKELWDLVLEDARSAPEARRQFLLMPALSTMLDDTASVLAATENRLPDAVFSIFSFCPQRRRGGRVLASGRKTQPIALGRLHRGRERSADHSHRYRSPAARVDRDRHDPVRAPFGRVCKVAKMPH